jgi:hypothetical protein
MKQTGVHVVDFMHGIQNRLKGMVPGGRGGKSCSMIQAAEFKLIYRDFFYQAGAKSKYVN